MIGPRMIARTASARRMPAVILRQREPEARAVARAPLSGVSSFTTGPPDAPADPEADVGRQGWGGGDVHRGSLSQGGFPSGSGDARDHMSGRATSASPG